MHRLLLLLLLCIAGIIAGFTVYVINNPVYADLIVVQDTGGTPLSQYINLNTLPLPATIKAAAAATPTPQIDPTTLEIPTPQTEFTPGTFSRHPITLNVPQPFFVIGPDAASLRWADTNATYLKSINALGFVIDVNSTNEIKTIESSTGLTLNPANLTGMSTILGVTHYPFLVTKGWISQ